MELPQILERKRATASDGAGALFPRGGGGHSKMPKSNAGERPPRAARGAELRQAHPQAKRGGEFGGGQGVIVIVVAAAAAAAAATERRRWREKGAQLVGFPL